MDSDAQGLPIELSSAEGKPKDTTWGLFGTFYQLGTLNFLTPAGVKAAASLVRTGRRFNLNLPLDEPSWPADSENGRVGYRHAHKQHAEGIGAGQKEDILDSLNTQGSTQWDGFGHVRHPRLGYYNGIGEADVRPGNESLLSIAAWTEAGGVVGRGVLVDLPTYFSSHHQPYDACERRVITSQVLDDVLAFENVRLGIGDILLVRTGAINVLRYGGRVTGTVGLGPGREIGSYLWRHRVAAVASDTGAFEATPIQASGERSVHMQLLPMIGMPIGELFYLEHLAEHCKQDGIYEFMFLSVPLNLPGGVASPANAIAIK